mgnify:CR=1 FL=1
MRSQQEQWLTEHLVFYQSTACLTRFSSVTIDLELHCIYLNGKVIFISREYGRGFSPADTETNR